MTLNNRLIAIAKRVADAHQRRAKIIQNDPVERAQYRRCMDNSYRVEVLAEAWERFPVKSL